VPKQRRLCFGLASFVAMDPKGGSSMDIEVKKGLFDYGPGELILGKDALNLHFSGRELTLSADSLRTAVFVPSKGGGCRVELSSDAGQVEIFIPRNADADELVAALYALAGGTGRLAIILDGRDR
jgi:hypothetical protein